MNNITLSLCMIVKNEEKVLSRCLNSVKDVVDEIIIVDTGCTDDTIKIANKYNTKIYSYNWNDDFSAARNYALKYATSDYILVLDADEYIESSEKIKEEIQDGLNYYYINIYNYMDNNNIYIHKAIRIFKNHIGLYYINKIHEYIPIQHKHSTIGQTTFKVYHTGYLKEVKAEKNKDHYYHRLLMEEVKTNPTAYNYYNLGVVLYNKENYKKALSLFQEAYESGKDYTINISILTYMAKCLIEMGQLVQSIELLESAIAVYPDYTDFYYYLGLTNGQLKRYKAAEDAFNNCIKLGNPTNYTISAYGVGDYLSYYNLALLYDESYDLDKAFDFAFRSIESNKNYLPAFLKYVEIMQKVSISVDDIYNQINMLFPITDLTSIKNIIFVLNELRSPLLLTYINNYISTNQKDKLATANLYSKNYNISFKLWNELEDIPKHNVFDIVLLSIIKGNDELLIKFKKHFNLSKSEWIIIKQIIFKQKLNTRKISNTLEELILELTKQVILLDLEEIYVYLHNLLLGSSLKLKLEYSNMLINYGLLDISKDVLYDILRNNPTCDEAHKLIVIILIRKNCLEDALNTLLLFKKGINEYWVLYYLYITYERIGNSQKSLEVLTEMNELYSH